MDTVKTLINANIKTNGNQEITGLVLNGVLNAMVDSVDANKQEKLSVEVLENGNIKLENLAGGAREFMPATPSGDPMHYAYESVGAVYNATGADISKTGVFGDTYLHKAGRWLLNEVGDLTNDDMGKVYSVYSSAYIPLGGNAGGYALEPSRTNIARRYFYNSEDRAVSFTQIAGRNNILENILISSRIDLPFYVKDLTEAFYNCNKLKKILNILTITAEINHLSFYNCTNLEFFKFNIRKSANFQHSPNVALVSLRYLVDNAANTSAITVTVHADIYAKLNNASLADWYQLREDATAKNISFATV